MKMDINTAKQILKENNYILESEGDLVDFALNYAEDLGLSVVDYKSEKEINYVDDNAVYLAAYTRNGNVYVRKGNVFRKATTEDDITNGISKFIDFIKSGYKQEKW